MPAPAGYDVGLQHASVNGGAAVGFLLDDARDIDAFVEDRDVIAHVDVTTGGVVSLASFGLGAVRYRLRLRLATDVLKRDHRPATEAPATLRSRILSFAAITDGLTVLQLATGDRRVGFVGDVRFVSGPTIDGYIAVLNLVDLGAG
jgi:hypothetical protein